MLMIRSGRNFDYVAIDSRIHRRLKRGELSTGRQVFNRVNRIQTHQANRIELGGDRFVIQGQRHACVGRVLWPQEATVSLGENADRPQVCVAVRAPVAEMVTVFCPLRPRQEEPQFTCEREDEGRFRIRCELGGRASVLSVSACTQGPLRRPLPVRLERR